MRKLYVLKKFHTAGYEQQLLFAHHFVQMGLDILEEVVLRNDVSNAYTSGASQGFNQNIIL